MQEMQANLGSQEDISKMEQMHLGRIAEIEQMLQASQMHHPHVSYACYSACIDVSEECFLGTQCGL